MLEIEQFVNEPVSSCCYIVSDKDKGDGCILIDPGSESAERLLLQLEVQRLTPEYIILTHEHFDHCWSVNALRDRFPMVKLVCSGACNKAVQTSKGNCSVFYDNQRAFVIAPADVVDSDLAWCGHDFQLVPTPGHSSGSISILVEQNVFTGDALIPGVKTVTKLPTGSVRLQRMTEAFLLSLSGCTFFPGHGDVFRLNNQNLILN